jgi:hypothetical protein
MYYLNSSNQNTCAPHPNVLATTEYQSEHHFSLCQPTTRLNFYQKNSSLGLRLYRITKNYFMYCLTFFLF